MFLLSRLKERCLNPYYRRKNAANVKKGAWQPHIMTLEETLKDILDNHLSISRFGDGVGQMGADGNKRDLVFFPIEHGGKAIGQGTAFGYYHGHAIEFSNKKSIAYVAVVQTSCQFLASCA